MNEDEQEAQIEDGWPYPDNDIHDVVEIDDVEAWEDDWYETPPEAYEPSPYDGTYSEE